MQLAAQLGAQAQPPPQPAAPRLASLAALAQPPGPLGADVRASALTMLRQLQAQQQVVARQESQLMQQLSLLVAPQQAVPAPPAPTPQPAGLLQLLAQAVQPQVQPQPRPPPQAALLQAMELLGGAAAPPVAQPAQPEAPPLSSLLQFMQLPPQQQQLLVGLMSSLGQGQGRPGFPGTG